jgi:hypothetical protein
MLSALVGSALGMAVMSMLLLAPAAFAAPPANDDFEDAQVVGPGLPVDLAESNAGATKEMGEPIHGPLGSKGHSVWFKWEATGTGFVTVGTCGSDFTTVISVYTGTKVDELTKVAGDFASEGPGCPSFDGREITFKAIGGTTYEIAVDGDPFYLPPAEPPVGEGTVELQVKATPVPANDDFADATPIVGSIEEEEGAGTAFYWVSTRGFNWNATKEVGEPEHGGDPGGASIWYRWVAPASGTARVGTASCPPFEPLLGIYTGAAVGALIPVETSSEEFKCSPVTFHAAAGTTYRIAVDGEFDAEAGEPGMGSLSLNVQMSSLPPRVKEKAPSSSQETSPPPKDTTPPNTMIHKRALKRRPAIVVFGFDSTEPGSTFRCKRDKRPWVDCMAPMKFTHPGRHVFRAAAVDASGNVDPSPALARFRIAGTKRR